MISDEQCQSINDERLSLWLKRLRDSHATALALVGVSHDGNGSLVICTCQTDERITAEMIGQLVIAAGQTIARS